MLQEFEYKGIQVSNFETLKKIIFDYVKNIIVEIGWNIDNFTPLNFRYCCLQCNNYIFTPYYNNIYRVYPNINNELNIENIYSIYNIFKELCTVYNMTVSIGLFIDFSGIPKSTLYALDKEQKPGSLRLDFLKKINADNEQTLVDKMQDKAINPMKIIPILNHVHNWSATEKAKERIVQETSIETLPDFSNNNLLE